MDATDIAPIIIKKVRKGGHGHHGGAWKVAFADFVTAMMAFFLLMWLIASTNTAQRKTIAAYFNDPLATRGYSGNGAGDPALDGGDGFLDGRGQNPFTGQSEDQTATSHGDDEAAAQRPDQVAIEQQRMQAMLAELNSVIDVGKALAEFADQLLFDITDEGLRIQIVDRENRAMFDTGAATLKPYAVRILQEIVAVIRQAPNKISISGHTDATAYAANASYGNWELSADRANAARRALVAAGLPPAQVGRVVGRGAAEPFDAAHPAAPVNRRISIVVLSSHGSEEVRGAASIPALPATPPAAAATRPSAAPLAAGPPHAGADWSRPTPP
ncbi:MAG: flagellar motor protein MotB [Gammaproteobacteria bacterium]|nr:flagellar motor protein MotB [Gammaproteobacteria bacterium]